MTINPPCFLGRNRNGPLDFGAQHHIFSRINIPISCTNTYQPRNCHLQSPIILDQNHIPVFWSVLPSSKLENHESRIVVSMGFTIEFSKNVGPWDPQSPSLFPCISHVNALLHRPNYVWVCTHLHQQPFGMVTVVIPNYWTHVEAQT